MKDTFRVLMPPPFEYLGGLFLPDLVRARLAARTAWVLQNLRAQGYRVSFDPGGGGLAAGERAKRLKSDGKGAAAVVARSVDRTGARVLEEALRAAGVDCGRTLFSEGGDDLLHSLSRRVESLAPMDIPSGKARTPVLPDPDGARGVLMVIKERESLPTGGVVFRLEDSVLVRETAGPAGSLPAWVERIRIVQPDGEEGAVREKPEDPILIALVLPGPEAIARDGAGPWSDRCRALAAAYGSSRLRLLPPDPPPLREGNVGGAGFAARYGLDLPAYRSFLLEGVSAILPERLHRLIAVLGLIEIGSDPLEEMYAACSLPDRNRELIENIVP